MYGVYIYFWIIDAGISIKQIDKVFQGLLLVKCEVGYEQVIVNKFTHAKKARQYFRHDELVIILIVGDGIGCHHVNEQGMFESNKIYWKSVEIR